MPSSDSESDHRDKKRRHKRDEDDDDDNEESSRRHHKKLKSSRHDKKRKDRHKKRKKKYESDSESSDNNSSGSDSESSSSSSRRRDRKRKSSRRKHDKKGDKKKRKHRRKHERDKDDDSNTQPSFGKYGILKATDKLRMQRSFEMWAEQVKAVVGRTSAHEEAKLWDEYREDYNTATLPHMKYYDYDKWELQEYEEANRAGGPAAAAADDQARLDRQRCKADAEKSLLLATMNSGKIQDMRRQAELRTQMQAAFKLGDMATYQKLKEKLEAE